MNLGKLSLLNYLSEDDVFKRFNDKENINISSPEALAIIVALSYSKKPRKMFFLFKDIYEATSFNQFLGDYLSEDEVYFFPHDDIFHLSALGISYEMKDERLLALSSTLNDKPSIFVSHLSACKLNITPKEEFTFKAIKININDFIDKDELIKKLFKIGYIKTDHIQQTSQIANRGMILDIFDPAYENPIRIEFFGNEVEDIRLFKIEDELSYKHVDNIIIYPSQLRLLNDNSLNYLKEEKAEFEKSEIVSKLKKENLEEIYNSLFLKVEEGYLSESDARFYKLLTHEENNILSYLDDYEKYLFNEDEIKKEEKDIKLKEKDYFISSVSEATSIEGEKIYVDEVLKLNDFTECHDEKSQYSLIIRENGYKSISYHESYQMIQKYLNDGYKVRVALSEPNLSNFAGILNEHNIKYSFYPVHEDVLLYDGKITHGFEAEKYKRVYLSSKEIFGVNDQKLRFLSRYKEAKTLRRYDEIKKGDYVVHDKHGIGRYLGVEKIDGLEYLKIEYANSAYFFLPLNQYKLIKKFSSKDGYTPALDKMGGSTWSRKKSQIRSKISFIADQLLEIYAYRMKLKGFEFKNEDELEKQFLDAFPFKHTDSQLAAIEEIKEDMNSSQPMDRLLAGDVGFGKTEVAFVSAFKAILNGKQVAFLCPTTILSMQHYNVAINRFKDFGVKICLFNRFIPLKEQNENIKRIKNGDIDLVIGTHRLLSDAIEFKDLGLLIVDEEQKFGVTHKEQIKAKTKLIDCLTLSATPIPRTLEISLLNVKSLSLLKEGPVNRMPVKTYVTKYDFKLVCEVIEKELDRKGQVYYLYNNIAGIETIAKKIQKQFKNHAVGICHAKMSENEIEDVMNKFYEKSIDILICTSIIESGLDIPNVNTIIVENADHFGLASLYQIKGRVGRSDRLAYAYFLYKDGKDITDNAKKRLKALTDFTELGSGYKIAMQDLNIRGAGDILGSKQSGFVDSLGYDAYMELLNEVIKEKSVHDKVEVKKEERFELVFSLDSAIPSSYTDEKSRINMYQELSSCHSKEDLVNYSRKIQDIYGAYPREVSNMIMKREIEIFLNSSLVEDFKEELGMYIIITSKEFSLHQNILEKLKNDVEPLNIRLKIRIVHNLFAFELVKTANYLSELIILINALTKAYED